MCEQRLCSADMPVMLPVSQGLFGVSIEMPAKDVSIDSNAQQPILTIYTCSGFLDTKRIIVTANYLGTIL